MKIHLHISIMYPSGIEILTNTKTFIAKGLLGIRSNYNFSKARNYHLVKVSQKKIHY
jgi:hypothetical protein